MILLHLSSSHQDHQLETFKTQREGQRGDRDAAERSVTSAGQWGLFFWFSTRTHVFSDLPSGADILPIDARNLARMDHGEKQMITQVIWSLHPLPKAHGSAHTFCWGELEKNQVHYMESFRTNCKIIILQENVVVRHEWSCMPKQRHSGLVRGVFSTRAFNWSDLHIKMNYYTCKNIIAHVKVNYCAYKNLTAHLKVNYCACEINFCIIFFLVPPSHYFLNTCNLSFWTSWISTQDSSPLCFSSFKADSQLLFEEEDPKYGSTSKELVEGLLFLEMIAATLIAWVTF